MFPKGFKAGGIAAGIKKNKKKDVALFYSDRPAAAAGMFTLNLVKAAPVTVSERHLKTLPHMRAVVANAGNANACTGPRGLRDAETMCRIAADEFAVSPGEVLVASTGVIGKFLPMAAMEKGIRALCSNIKMGKTGEIDAARAIMTTDLVSKVTSKTIAAGGKKVTLWGCAKGSGMIHPVMGLPHATMLAFILTDANITSGLLRESLERAVDSSFNCISVDGDSSTNDSVVVLANGAAGNKTIAAGKDLHVFKAALSDICLALAKMIARDGEGATKLVSIEVLHAADDASAKKIAATVATSPLVKTALFGNDANWGRILAAAGRAGVDFPPGETDIRIGDVLVARSGMATAFSEAKAKKALQKKEVTVTVDLHQGVSKAVYYTCDLTFDYIKINASYRS